MTAQSSRSSCPSRRRWCRQRQILVEAAGVELATWVHVEVRWDDGGMAWEVTQEASASGPPVHGRSGPHDRRIHGDLSRVEAAEGGAAHYDNLAIQWTSGEGGRPMRAVLLIGLALTTLIAPSAAFASDGTTRPPVGGEAAPDFDLPAVRLRIELGSCARRARISEHRSHATGIAGGPEFEVAAEALEKNTVEVVELIRAAYGDDAADAFAEQWRNHIAYLVDYTRIHRGGQRRSSGRRIPARHVHGGLQRAPVAANPGLPADVVQGLINEHVQQLRRSASSRTEDS